MVPRRLPALAGIAAPVCFVSAWALAGARLAGYSPVREHISELARVGVPTRPLMTAGMVGFGVLAPVWAVGLPRGLRTSVGAAGLATLGVAAAPLGASFGDGPHVAAAAASYVAMASTPLLGAHLGAPRLSRATGIASAVLLLASLVDSPVTGLLQRSGLGVVDAWFVAQGVRQLRG
ncbi:MAG: rane protein [Frankiales bacterium]|nr:rane protein [Frankiales bacterium]